MKKVLVFVLGSVILLIAACTKDRGELDFQIPDFNFPQNVVFEQNLTAYDVYSEPMADLMPAEGFQELELTSVLFTDYAHKQRLVKVPDGTQMTRLNDGSIEFPDGTILTKTFFYYVDEQDTSLGKRIIETRLLVKENSVWNVATYIWNENQSEATLEMDGRNTQVSWIDANGSSFTTEYHIPSQNECFACHQSNSEVTPIGPTMRNLNRDVERDGESLNQLAHLQSTGILNDFPIGEVSQIVDYTNSANSLEDRGRAYLDMNCAHCHNPNAWERSAEREFDFRYENSIGQTGIQYEESKIIEAVSSGTMPLIGTTLPDEEGVDLVIDFIQSL